MPPDDADIMRAVQRGELALFEVLVQRYRGPLFRAAVSRLGDSLWAEDVVQETFLAAFSARDTYRPQFAFRTWLWTILLNLCSRQWRRRQARPERSAPIGRPAADTAELPEPVVEETGLTVVLQTERRERLLAGLNQLPEVQADALRLRFFGELSFSEIAAVMGSSLGAAKMRVKNGLIALSHALRDEESSDDLR